VTSTTGIVPFDVVRTDHVRTDGRDIADDAIGKKQMKSIPPGYRLVREKRISLSNDLAEDPPECA
jgi:hypothetical protein